MKINNKALGAMAAAAAFLAPAHAEERIFMDAGIRGDAQTEGYFGQIVLKTANFGVTRIDDFQRGGTGTGTGAGACTNDTIELVKDVDSATADLFQRAVTGRVLSNVVITITEPTGQRSKETVAPVLAIRLTDAFVTKMQTFTTETGLQEVLSVRFFGAEGIVYTTDVRGTPVEEPFELSCLTGN